MVEAELAYVSREEAERGRFFDTRPRIVQDVLRSRDRRILVDGPLGTGETRLLLEKVRQCCLSYPGSRWFILRSVRKWLTNSALVTWEDKVLESGLLLPDRIQRASRSEYRFKNGSVVVEAKFICDNARRTEEYEALVAGLKQLPHIADAVVIARWVLMEVPPPAPAALGARSGTRGSR